MVESGDFLRPFLEGGLPWLYRESHAWTAFGLLGNALFSSRFIYQWLHSERRGRVEVPVAFWHISFWGSVVALIYALHVDKLPIVLSYAFLPVLYGRNLVLLRRSRRADEAAKGSPQ